MMPPEDPFQPNPSDMVAGSRSSTNMTMLSVPSKPNPNPRVGDSGESRALDIPVLLLHQPPPSKLQNQQQQQQHTTVSVVDLLPSPSPLPSLAFASNSNPNSMSVSSRSSWQPVTLKFEHVCYKVKLKSQGCCMGIMGTRLGMGTTAATTTTEKLILDDVSGMVYPGEMLAMLGPSGSGKTTLLSALAGRLLLPDSAGGGGGATGAELSGRITYNGHGLSTGMKRRTGYVAQDDVLYAHLTVEETLLYAALLQGFPSASSEAQAQVEAVMTELGLLRCSQTRVGGGLIRGVSGGERKRVSIGVELLSNPSIVFVDEATSGLDSTTAQRIVGTLLRLARLGGRTVVATIHQPSSRLFHMFSKVLLLCHGSPIFYGPASSALPYFSSLGFSTPYFPVNPADFMLDLANGITPEVDTKISSSLQEQAAAAAESLFRSDHEQIKHVKQSLVSAYRTHLATTVLAQMHADDAASTRLKNIMPEQGQWTTGWWHQFSVLLRRGLKERKYESFSGLRIFQVLTISTLSGLLWWHSSPDNVQDQDGLLFFFSIFWGFFPLFNAIFTFPQEKAMLIKEQSSGLYRLSAYFAARMVGDLPMELALPTVFTGITYWMGGLKPDAGTFLLTVLVILLNVLVTQGLGQALGAVLMDVKKATTLASVTMLTFLLAGGYYVQRIPPFISWLKYISFSYYCYKLLVGVQYTEHQTYRCGAANHDFNRRCRVADYPAIKGVGLDHKAFSVLALFIMLFCYRAIAYGALRRLKLRTN